MHFALDEHCNFLEVRYAVSVSVDMAEDWVVLDSFDLFKKVK
jgi:hypothetical protein